MSEILPEKNKIQSLRESFAERRESFAECENNASLRMRYGLRASGFIFLRRAAAIIRIAILAAVILAAMIRAAVIRAAVTVVAAGAGVRRAAPVIWACFAGIAALLRTAQGHIIRCIAAILVALDLGIAVKARACVRIAAGSVAIVPRIRRANPVARRRVSFF
jgi:hypothetical protein